MVDQKQSPPTLKIEREIISASVSKSQRELLDLVALKNETTRSDMFSRLLTEQVDANQTIRAIAERLVANYCEANVGIDVYLRAAKTWLEQKKISAYYIERIIQEIRHRYEA